MYHGARGMYGSPYAVPNGYAAYNASFDPRALVTHPNFTQARSPCSKERKIIAYCPVYPKRTATLKVNLNSQQLAQLRKKPSPTHELHLRLFNTQHQHTHWPEVKASLFINRMPKEISIRQIKKSVKKLGLVIVKPLNISKEASQLINLNIELSCQTDFSGVLVAEFVKKMNLEVMADDVKKRSASGDENKKCAVCGATSNLLRCSRCKSAWYCGQAHQIQDWPTHQRICMTASSKPKLKRLRSEPQTDDAIAIGETRVSLRCPLTVMRIKTPVRGQHCDHPQCIDLIGYIGFSESAGNWQCPVCMKPLPYPDLVVDQQMSQILRSTDDEVDQVRLYPNGKYKPITLEEQRAADRKIGRGRKKRKTEVVQQQATQATNESAPVTNTIDDAIVLD